MTDGLLIDGFGRVFTRRAAARNCLVDIHCALMPRFRKLPTYRTLHQRQQATARLRTPFRCARSQDARFTQ
jgi:hypothetical protein